MIASLERVQGGATFIFSSLTGDRGVEEAIARKQLILESEFFSPQTSVACFILFSYPS
jgi:hypothetical protein